MKKTLSFVLAVIIIMQVIVCTGIVSSAKDPDDITAVGIGPVCLNETYFTGDLNGDGKLTPADARAMLRIAAGLEKPATNQLSAIEDFKLNNIPYLTAARQILRAAVGVEKLITRYVSRAVGQEAHVVYLDTNSGSDYDWDVTVDDPDAFDISYVYYNFNDTPDEVIGGTVSKYYTIVPKKAGTYMLHFFLADKTSGRDIIKEYYVEMTVREAY